MIDFVSYVCILETEKSFYLRSRQNESTHELFKIESSTFYLRFSRKSMCARFFASFIPNFFAFFSGNGFLNVTEKTKWKAGEKARSKLESVVRVRVRSDSFWGPFFTMWHVSFILENYIDIFLLPFAYFGNIVGKICKYQTVLGKSYGNSIFLPKKFQVFSRMFWNVFLKFMQIESFWRKWW